MCEGESLRDTCLEGRWRHFYAWRTYVYMRTTTCPYTYGTALPSVCRSTTRNTPWTRPAARHGTRLPWMSPGNDPSASLALFLHPSRDRFFPPPATFFFSSLFYILSFLAILLFPHPPCYRVQGQPIEGNFLVLIASACPPRTIHFVLLFLF